MIHDLWGEQERTENVIHHLWAYPLIQPCTCTQRRPLFSAWISRLVPLTCFKTQSPEPHEHSGALSLYVWVCRTRRKIRCSCYCRLIKNTSTELFLDQSGGGRNDWWKEAFACSVKWTHWGNNALDVCFWSSAARNLIQVLHNQNAFKRFDGRTSLFSSHSRTQTQKDKHLKRLIWVIRRFREIFKVFCPHLTSLMEVTEYNYWRMSFP